MPTYIFKCSKCERYDEFRCTFNDVKDKEAALDCIDCKVPMQRDYNAESSTHTYLVKRDVLKPKNVGRHSDDIQKAQAAKIDLAIAAEPFSGNAEIKESLDMAREEEVKRGKTPGALSTGVAPIQTKEAMQEAKKVWKKKKEISRELRKKVK